MYKRQDGTCSPPTAWALGWLVVDFSDCWRQMVLKKGCSSAMERRWPMVRRGRPCVTRSTGAWRFICEDRPKPTTVRQIQLVYVIHAQPSFHSTVFPHPHVFPFPLYHCFPYSVITISVTLCHCVSLMLVSLFPLSWYQSFLKVPRHHSLSLNHRGFTVFLSHAQAS